MPQGTLNFYDGSTANPPLNATSIVYTGNSAVYSLTTLGQRPHHHRDLHRHRRQLHQQHEQHPIHRQQGRHLGVSSAPISPPAPTYGQAVTLNATVLMNPTLAGYGVPTGNITFWDGPVGTGINLGTNQWSTASANGQASITTNATGLGSPGPRGSTPFTPSIRGTARSAPAPAPSYSPSAPRLPPRTSPPIRPAPTAGPI